MIVATLELELKLDGCFSLKDKRRVIRGLIDRTRREFGVSIAEVADHDIWNSAVIGAAVVSNEASHAESIIAKVLETFSRHPEVEVLSQALRLERISK